MENCSGPEYFNSGKGFEAKIKLMPGHFIVDELSSFDGEITPAASSNTPDMESSVNNGLKRPAQADAESSSEKRLRTSVIDDSCREVPESRWDDLDNCRQELEEILGPETHLNLNNFAQKVKTDAGKSYMSPMEIGTFSERDKRTFVHRCIRMIHPFLKSVTKPHTGEVSVQCCPNYWKFAALLGHDMSSKIFKFIHIEVFENVKKQISVEGQYTKDERRQIHQLVASSFGKFLETRTFSSSEDDEHRVITIRRKPHLDKTPQSDYEDAGIITAFTLWKKNCETYAASYYLGRHLNILQKMFNYAGIKDKRAITTQKCTVTGISPEKFEAICKTLPKFLKVSGCQRVSRVIRLGELDGNRFRIKLTRIRNLQPATENSCLVQDIHTAVENVKTTGFINYFGPQRFGRCICWNDNAEGELPITLEAPAAGLAMLQNNFKKAVDVLLSPTENMSSESDMAKKHFQETRNIDETLKMMPSQKLRELSILRTLKRIGTMDNDACIKAVLSLPHSARLLYVHSFSSYLWNEMATARIRKYGNQIVEGDFVKQSGDGSKSTQVISVTAEDIARNSYTVKDVVLPVPGSQVYYPPCLEKEYGDILEKFSIDTNHMYRIPALRIYAPGAYRNLIQTPTNLSVRILPHKDARKVRVAKQKLTNECEESFVAMEKDDAIDTLQLIEQKRTDQFKDTDSVSTTEKDDAMNKPQSIEQKWTDRCKDTDPVATTIEKDDAMDKLQIIEQKSTDQYKNTDPVATTETDDAIADLQLDTKNQSPEFEKFDVGLTFDLPPSCYATTFLSELTKGHLK